ncbi:MAG TPA: hypothetical protein VK420_14910, partial [Longimicrobium sp.]|nr:hypothetical protein [Longimicrobium sp.]
DVLFLADRVNKNTPVRFRDIQGRTGEQDASGAGSRVDSLKKAGAGAGGTDSASSRPARSRS